MSQPDIAPLADLEARLRRELGPLADALLAEDAPSGLDASSGLDAPSGLDTSSGLDASVASVGRFGGGTGRRLALVAAAAALVLGAFGLWRVAGGENRIETGPIEPGPTTDDGSAEDGQADETGQWTDLPPAPDGVRSRGQMVSVWTGTEALYWGGRSDSDLAPEAFVGGLAFDPNADTWRQIAAPQWGHPGASGAYLSGFVYVVAKGAVTRFDPGSGDEAQLALDSRLLPQALATDGDEVVAFGPAAGGFGFQVVGPVPGELQVFERAGPLADALIDDGQSIEVLAWDRSRYAVVMPDLSVWSLSTSGSEAELVPVVARPTGPDPQQVELVATDEGPMAVHLQGDGEQIDIFGLADDFQWNLPGEYDDFDDVTVIGAGEWIVLLQPRSNSVAFRVNQVDVVAPVITDLPIGRPLGRMNPNAVWTGQELIVWGGNDDPAIEQAPSLGGRFRPPDLVEPNPVDDVDQVVDEGGQLSAAVQGESEFQWLQRLLDELPIEQRVPASPYDEAGDIRFDHQWTDAGLWVYSRPEPKDFGPLSEAGEILLLEDWGGPIIDSWPLGYFPGGYNGDIEVAPDAVYCMFKGDGGLPDSQICRIDLATGRLTMAIYTAAFDGGDEAFYQDLYLDSDMDWQVIAHDGSETFGPSGWLYLDGAAGLGDQPTEPAMVGPFGSGRIDPGSLTIVDVEQTDSRAYPCPHRSDDIPVVDKPGLPPAVETTYRAILAAAATCDVEALEALSGSQLTVPNRDGGMGMVALAQALTFDHDVVAGGAEEGGQNVYLFPTQATAVSRVEFETLARFYGPKGDDHLTIILEDGTWQVTVP